MTDLWQRLKQRKLVQWALAYVAFAFALLQGIDIVAAKFAWPDSVERMLIIALCVGFFVTVLLAWYHGEQGRQRVSGAELLLMALVLAVGGGFLWQFSRAPGPATPGGRKAPTTVSNGEPAPVRTRHASTATPREAVAAVSNSEVTSKSIAVLPFENLSSDKDNGYFADGMQDLILTKLADIGRLKVISRTSTHEVRQPPGRPEDGRPPTWRCHGAGRQRAEGRQPGADQRAADRCADGRAHLGPRATSARWTTCSASRARLRAGLPMHSRPSCHPRRPRRWRIGQPAIRLPTTPF